MRTLNDTHCGLCGEAFPPTSHTGASGYAVLHGCRTRICYPCADAREATYLRTASKATGYLASAAAVSHGYDYISGQARYTAKGYTLTTWTGGTLATVRTLRRTTGITPSGGRYERWYGTAVDVHGQRWRFNGPGPGMYARMTRCAP